MLKLFPLTSLEHTIFEKKYCIDVLTKNSIEFTNNIYDANILLSREFSPFFFSKLNSFDPKIIANKSILIWTHEPRFCKLEVEIMKTKTFPEFNIMNMYTRNVYFSNLTFYGHNVDRQLDYLEDVNFREKRIASLCRYVNENKQEIKIGGINIDLTVKRQNLALLGHEMGILDIIGKSWPNGIAKSESRNESWHAEKLEILENYQFNIAMENTSFDYYCTEKIWDSIKSYCLPIYSSFNNRIYELFPKDSFIDFDSFNTTFDLLMYIKNITKEEYLTRLNKCIYVNNKVFENVNLDFERNLAVESLILKLHHIGYNQMK